MPTTRKCSLSWVLAKRLSSATTRVVYPFLHCLDVAAAQQQQRNARAVQLYHEVAEQLTRIAGRGAGVENVARNQHRIHGVACTCVSNHSVKARCSAWWLLPMKCWPRCQSEVWRMRMGNGGVIVGWAGEAHILGRCSVRRTPEGC